MLAARTIAKPRLGYRRPPVIILHSSRCQTARPAASAAQHFSFPRRIFCVRGVTSLFSLSPPHLRCLGRRFGRLAPETLTSAAAPTPNRGGRGAPGGVGLLRVAPVRRDLTLARRESSRATRTPASRRSTVALSAQVRSVSGIAAGAGAKAARRPLFMAAATRAFRVRGYEPRSTPLPAPPAGSSPEDAPHERGWRIFYHIFVT